MGKAMEEDLVKSMVLPPLPMERSGCTMVIVVNDLMEITFSTLDMVKSYTFEMGKVTMIH